MINAISVDVEEYFHPSELQPYVTSEQWKDLPSRVEGETLEILELFARHSVTATFFILGWVAEMQPTLVRTIASAGHEIGCHSFAHKLVYELTPEEFRTDTLRAMAAISGATGSPVTSYRAPSYSITERSMWALEILADLGFTHDSSIYPVAHDRYGIPGFPRSAHQVPTRAGALVEVPIATVLLCGTGQVLPVGGGAYLRLFPYRYTAAGIRRRNTQEREPACVYFHPWEIDPAQPRLASGSIARMRTYTGLHSMKAKIDRLVSEFQFSTIESVFPSPVSVIGSHL